MRIDIYRIILTFIAAGSWLASSAQYEWRNLGPDNIGNITRAIAFYNDGNNLLAGAQGGGLWKSANQGESWEKVLGFDQADPGGGNPNVTSIAVDGSVIYVATGATRFDRTYAQRSQGFGPTYDYRTDRSSFFGNLTGKPGAGVYVSTDNGETWSNDNPTSAGAEDVTGPFTDIMKVIVHKGILYIGTAQGLYYSDDNLQSVQLVEGTDFIKQNVVFDLEVAGTGNDERIYASVHIDSDIPTDSIFYAPVAGGTPTFQAVVDEQLVGIGSPFFDNRSQRTEIAVAPSNPNIIYVASTQASGEIAGVYRHDISSPGNWEIVAPQGTPGFTPLGSDGRDAFVLSVFPDNENELILAGLNWYTLSDAERWTQTAQHFNPSNNTYIPRSMFTVVFDPNDPNHMVVGTSSEITVSFDGGQTFVRRSKGYESTSSMRVHSFGFELEGETPEVQDVIITSTQSDGVLYNRNYAGDTPSRQGFGVISARQNTNVAASTLFPGALLIQGNDNGIVRSINQGEVYEPFYGLPVVPGVSDINDGDTLVAASATVEENEVEVTTITPADTVIVGTDTTITPADTMVEIVIERDTVIDVADLMLSRYRPNVPQSQWILDEVVPPALLDSIQADPSSPAYKEFTVEEVQEGSESYVFYCSSQYLWIAQGAFGDLLQTKWNRVTPALVDGDDEFFTAITVSGDTNHVVYLGTNLGRIFRVNRAHDFQNLDFATDIDTVVKDFPAQRLSSVRDRWITDIAIDPDDSDRLAVSFAGYGSFTNAQGGIWITDNANDELPLFGFIASGTFLNIYQTYALAFVNEPGQAQSTLLAGTDRGLFALRDIPPVDPNLPVIVLNQGTETLEWAEGNVPVYDIHIRPYTTVVTENALIRQVPFEVPQGDSSITELREVEFDRMVLNDDNTLFIATHGRGIWSTATLSARRGRPGDGPIVLPNEVAMNIGPNPASYTDQPVVYLDLPESADLSLAIYDLSGRRVWLESASFEAGEQAWQLDLPDMMPGAYLIVTDIQGEQIHFAKPVKLIWNP